MSFGGFGDAALAYAAKGWAVFPCQPRGKVPAVAGGFHAATVDVPQIRAWWRAEPAANIGLSLRLGVLVLDVDARHAGHESLAGLEAQHGRLPATLTASTPSGGRHLFLRVPEGATVRQTAGELGAGLDTRCSGKGYVLAAPSIGADGQPYRWHDRSPIAAAPAWLVGMLVAVSAPPRTTYVPSSALDRTRRSGYALRALEGEARAVAETPAGGRNHRLTAAWLRCARDLGDVLPRAIVRAELTRAALAAGLDAHEIQRTLRDDLADGRRAA